MNLKTRELRIPAWILSSLVVISIAILGFTTTQIKDQQRVSDKVKDIEQDLIEHKQYTNRELESKAEQSDIIWVKESLRRIESKLDKVNEKE